MNGGRSVRTLLLPLAGAAAMEAGAQPGDEVPPLHFQDVTAESGIDFTPTSGDFPLEAILEVKGGGLGLIDYDGDGDLDLFVPNGATLEDPHNGPGCRLFENRGSMRFEDATERARLTFNRWAMGVTVGDYDADGHDDIFIACYGPNALLRNRGDGTFEDVTAASGIDGDAWSTGCALGDVDADGDLDLYVVNYLEFDPDQPPPPGQFKSEIVFGGPRGMVPSADVLYLNRGDGTFRDATEEAGCVPQRPRYGLGVAILDLTGDGRQDIYVGNDSDPNFLFVNEGDATFSEQGLFSGLAANMDGYFQATMGIGIADVDGNGRPDVFTTNFSSDTNTLHLNLDGSFFEDRTRAYGLGMVSRTYLSWACGFYDFDHDADEDLFIVNGHVYSQATMETMDSSFRQTPNLFVRDGDRFELAEPSRAGDFLAEKHVDRTFVAGDLDADGDIDIVIAELNGPLRVIENVGADASGRDWLIVELRERPGVGNRHGVGSMIELRDPAADAPQRRWIVGGAGFQSHSAHYAHFGLGEDPGPVELTITWPDGATQTVENVRPSRHLVVERR